MKIKLFFSLIILVKFSFCQEIKYDKSIVENFKSMGILEAPFMIDELFEIYPKDTLCIKRTFNRAIFDRTEYTLYCYNVSTDFFYSKLIEKRNNKNNEIVDKILSDLDYDKNVIKPQIDWAEVFKTCHTCPFGEYPDDRFFYFKFSIMYMGEKEIKEMIDYSNGMQWKYALMAIKGGDSFVLNQEDNYFQYVLDRRIATYIIERWKDSKIPEVQELIATFKNGM